MRPGDLIVGDNDGVVVIPLQFVEKIREFTKEIAQLEDDMRQKVRSGMSWKEIYRGEHKNKYFMLENRSSGKSGKAPE